ncbi:MAG TPA: bis(5'-nucleosyl)-tetraphosphatase (symmetrical) YqeK [Candidatus Tumulicola sp.]|jgi:predicted HD superfamily hydrolase involved in NAD metabolism
MTFNDLSCGVREHVGQAHRYAHCVRVARSAELLAMRHGVSSEKARVAGMLHDLARLYTADRLVGECRTRNIAIDAFEAAHPIVLHAPLSAALAEELFGVRDPEITSAIARHTLAAAAMSPLDCIVYIADGVEPGRTFDERASLWDTAMEDLHEGMKAVLYHGLLYTISHGRVVAPQTYEAARAFGLHPEEITAFES